MERHWEPPEKEVRITGKRTNVTPLGRCDPSNPERSGERDREDPARADPQVIASVRDFLSLRPDGLIHSPTTICKTTWQGQARFRSAFISRTL